MQLNPAEISELIKSRIEGLGISADVRNQGTVVSVTDGICRVHGLSDVMQGEMLEFPGNTFGLALNLERDSVGAVVLGAYEHIKEGLLDRGESEDKAEEIAARTVNKERARKGEARTASKTSTDDISSGRRGGLRSHSGAKGRTYRQLYAEARDKGIDGRSKMTKAQLQRAVDRH